MKILIAPAPAMGHLNPLLAIGRVLIAEGHEVVGLSGSALRSRIEGTGEKFTAFPAGGDLDLRDLLSGVPDYKTYPRGRDGCGAPLSACSPTPSPLSTRACSRF